MRLRTLLAGLVAGALVPLAALSAIVIARVAEDERAAVERRLTEGSRAVADAVDREATATLRALLALGGSERLERGDVAGFAGEAARAVATQPTWVAIVLFTASGVRASDTRRENATAEPVLDPESLLAVVRTGRPAIGNLVLNSDGRWAFSLRVPVRQDGSVRWILNAVVSADAIGEILSARGDATAEWTRTVVDGTGRVVARSRAPERFVGALATPSFVQATGGAAEGVYRDVTLDGESAYVAFTRATVSGWTAAVVAPAALLDGPLRRSLVATGGVALALLVLGAGGVLLVSRRFSRAVGSVAVGAQALARGERPSVDAHGIAELAELGDALRRSADLLAARARERDEHLARAESARAEAEAANRTKDEFLALLGHELRNPLSPIVTALRLLEQRGLAGTREHAIVRRQVAHLVRLVDDLLDVSRITRGKVTLRLVPVEAQAFVARAVEMASDLVEQRRHRLAVNVPPGLLVQGDPDRLAQVVANLLTNAARYTAPGGNVSVWAGRRDAQIAVEVSDDGRGLTPELRRIVFEPFVQGPRTPDRHEGGLGLGLTLVRTLVAMHGGHVEARSEGLGTGSTFVVELPAAGAAAAPPPPGPPGALPRSRRPLRVLVVDDNADAAALVADVLASAGHRVHVAADGPSALDVAAELAPDAAILDIGLPVMDGYELAARLRQRLAPAPAMIALTGYGQEADHERSRGAGFRCHLVKPAEPDALLAELERIAAERYPDARSAEA